MATTNSVFVDTSGWAYLADRPFASFAFPLASSDYKDWSESPGLASGDAGSFHYRASRRLKSRLTGLRPQSPPARTPITQENEKTLSGDEWPLALPAPVCYTTPITGCTSAQVRRGPRVQASISRRVKPAESARKQRHWGDNAWVAKPEKLPASAVGSRHLSFSVFARAACAAASRATGTRKGEQLT